MRINRISAGSENGSESAGTFSGIDSFFRICNNHPYQAMTSLISWYSPSINIRYNIVWARNLTVIIVNSIVFNNIQASSITILVGCRRPVDLKLEADKTNLKYNYGLMLELALMILNMSLRSLIDPERFTVQLSHSFF